MTTQPTPPPDTPARGAPGTPADPAGDTNPGGRTAASPATSPAASPVTGGAPPVAVGLAWGTTAPVSSGLDLLTAARHAGLDSFWAQDHLISTFPRAAWDPDFTYLAHQSPTPDNTLDFATVLGHFAAHAGTVQLGVGVTDPHRRHPALLAQSALTLAQMTDVPPILGIGAGAVENLAPYGIAHDHPVSRVEEALQVIRACLAGEGPLHFNGRYFSLDHALMDLRAPSGNGPRLWLGANGPRMMELAGRHADGWLPWEPMAPDEYRRRLDIVRAAAASAGRDPDAITPALGIILVVGSTDAEARRMLRAKPVRYLGLSAGAAHWRRHGVPHPFGDDYRGMPVLLPHRLGRSEAERAIAAVPEAILDDLVVHGSPDTVRERITALAGAGLRHAVLIPASAMVSPDAAGLALGTVLDLPGRLRPPARPAPPTAPPPPDRPTPPALTTYPSTARSTP